MNQSEKLKYIIDKRKKEPSSFLVIVEQRLIEKENNKSLENPISKKVDVSNGKKCCS